MKTTLILLTCVVAFISFGDCKDLIIGTSFNNRLLWQEKAEYNAIPLRKRVKEVFFSDPGQQIIKGIVARDIDQSNAVASVTAGGVGQSFVNIRLKSERGSGLNYHIEIYV